MSFEKFVIKSCKKTSSSVFEAFNTPEYATAIQRPVSTDFSGFGAFLGALAFVAVFGYCFWLTIGRF